MPPKNRMQRLVKQYSLPILIDWAGMPLELLCAELARTNCIYEFEIGGSRVCEGTFEAVLLNAYECAALFSIPDEVKTSTAPNSWSFSKSWWSAGAGTGRVCSEPRHAFLPGLDQSLVDKSTEQWLDSIERRLRYERWFCGHYHIDDQEGPVRIVHNDFLELDDENMWEGI